MSDFLWLVIALPLAGALFLHFFGRYLREPLAGVFATLAIGAAFVVAVVAAVPFFAGTGEAEHLVIWEWMPAVGATFELQWDPLSALMTLVVTGVGTLIHLFAIGYMHGDERFHRFFTYLNLFAASMLTLVLAGNYAMLFIGWELVGLCSYLLIGFWFTRPSAAAAAKKAFVVNRIGDLGFLIGLMVMFATFGTLSFEGVLGRAATELTVGTATAIGLLFLVGAAGKSAQVPLYVWLPDAMEGPTPVSALIHAATMVTAGVYVVARSSPIYVESPIASGTVAVIGAITALWAASIAIGQRDIKKVSPIRPSPARVHVHGRRGDRIRRRRVPPHDPRLLQGAPVPRRRVGDPRHVRRAGHVQDGRPGQAHAHHRYHHGHRHLAIAGIPAGRLLVERRDPRRPVRTGRHLLGVVGGRLIGALMTAFYMTRQWVLVFAAVPAGTKGWSPTSHRR